MQDELGGDEEPHQGHLGTHGAAAGHQSVQQPGAQPGRGLPAEDSTRYQ